MEEDTYRQQLAAMDRKLYREDPRGYALQLVEEGNVSADHLLTCALQFMSHTEVQEMLDANELSPRFDYSNEDKEDEEE